MPCWRKKPRLLFRRLLLILLPLAALAVYAEMRLAPVVEAAALQQAHGLALREMSAAVEDQLALHPGAGDYQQLMYIERDSEGRITLLVTDTRLINRLLSSLVQDAEQRLHSLEKQKLTLPLLSASGSRVFAGFGPEIGFRFRSSSAPTVRVKSEFSGAGVNQTRHSIYAELCADIRVIAPFSRAERQVVATVLLAEGVIVGYTPDTYVNIAPSGQ